MERRAKILVIDLMPPFALLKLIAVLTQTIVPYHSERNPPPKAHRGFWPAWRSEVNSNSRYQFQKLQDEQLAEQFSNILAIYEGRACF